MPIPLGLPHCVRFHVDASGRWAVTVSALATAGSSKHSASMEGRRTMGMAAMRASSDQVVTPSQASLPLVSYEQYLLIGMVDCLLVTKFRKYALCNANGGPL